MEWFINRQNKVPYYLQLRDLIRYHISTGALQRNEKLPTVHGLAKELGVNFETIRKAYKELEREGLVSTGRGRGTFVNEAGASRLLERPRDQKRDSVESLRGRIRQYLSMGGDPEALKRLVDEMHESQTRVDQDRFAIFAECNSFQARQISGMLKDAMGMDVRPTLLKDLRSELTRMGPDLAKLLVVITTGFHVDEVRHAVGNHKVRIEFVITSMSPQTRRTIEEFPKTAKFGFICRDEESREFYRNLLKSELGLKSELLSCIIQQTEKVKKIVNEVQVLLVSPSVYETMRELVPPNLPFFNILDRVDPMSLKVLRDKILTPPSAPAY